MKNKILSLFLIIAFVAIAAISSTMAYFTDTDHAKNVFTVGNVEIELIEQQRDAEGKLVEYVNGKPLYPAIYYGTPALDSSVATPDGSTADIFGNSVANVQDKIVSVQNTGLTTAYVRVLFAFEDKLLTDGTKVFDLIHTRFNDDALVGEVEWLTDANGQRALVSLDVDGEIGTYSICSFTYANPVASNNYTPASLLQFYLDPAAGNEFSSSVGAKYDIWVMAQAVQSDGFMNATHALDTAFGDFTADKAAEWFAQIDTTVYDG